MSQRPHVICLLSDLRKRIANLYKSISPSLSMALYILTPRTSLILISGSPVTRCEYHDRNSAALPLAGIA